MEVADKHHTDRNRPRSGQASGAPTALRMHLGALACFGLIGVLFYWKFLLTHQYSLLTGFEGANQVYSWYTFIARTIREGSWPLWDPYTFSGRSFVGEMQTGTFYPLNLLLAAVPFNNRGMFSPAFYHWLYAATHMLGAYFTFVLARTLGLSAFASLVSGVCFSFGGFMARLGAWPHLYQSGIWLPLICLCTIKALKTPDRVKALAYSILGGLSLGLSILAGGLHLVVMQAVLVVAAGIALRERWARTALVITAVLVTGAMAGAVQLLPSIEYSGLALRYTGGGALMATEKLAYHNLNHGLLANAVFGLLFGAPANQIATGEYISPYLGVLPLLLAALAIWKCWSSIWVRCSAVLVGTAYLYSLGEYSFLHGISYALMPFLWMAREAGRFMYLADFGLAILAGFGAERALMAWPDDWSVPKKVLAWMAGASMIALAVPAIFGKPGINPWGSLSLLLIALASGVLLYVLSGNRGIWPRVLILGLILFDLYAFDWTAPNRLIEASKGSDQLERLLSFEDAARFLKSKNEVFRVDVSMDSAPNIGDAFGIQTTWGGGVTVPANYDRIKGNMDLLNAKYIVRPASAAEPDPVYADRNWKIYENPTAYPRAWLVSEPRTLGAALPPPADHAAGTAVIESHGAREIRLRTEARGRALLVLSEVFYPGWRAKVNGRDAEITEVNGALRGILVPGGESRVTLEYAPRSVAIGAAFSLIAFCMLPLAVGLLLRRQHAVQL